MQATVSARPLPQRMPGIDALRGLSVLLVALHHIHLRFVLNHFDVTTLLPKAAGRVVFWSGYYAVIAFFVISGFLITTLSLRRWGTLPTISLRQFYRLRLARIGPCLLALVIILAILHSAGVANFVIDPNRATLGRAILAALTFHLNWLEGTRGYLPGNWDVLWSLSIEETFYLVFPLACIVLRRERLLLLPIALLICIGPIARVLAADREPWSEYAYLACMDGIAFGCLAALVAHRFNLQDRTLRYIGGIGIAAIALIVVTRETADQLGLVASGLYITVLEFGVAAALLALSRVRFDSLLSRSTRWLQFVGRASYEIYLTHMFVVFAFIDLFKRTTSDLQNYWAWYALMLAASVALGYAVARWFSEPLNRALRRGTASTTASQPAAVSNN